MESKFKLVHMFDESKDIVCSLIWKKEGRNKKYEWINLPDFLETEVRSQFSKKDMKSCPQFCLNLVLRQVIKDVERLKKVDELKPTQA